MNSVTLPHLDKRTHDKRRLSDLFYQSFDSSKVFSFFRRLPPKTLGEGAHFRVYKLASSSSSLPALSVNIAKPNFYEGKGPQFRKHWIGWIKTLRHEVVDLIPPLEVIEDEDTLAIVMPFGEDPIEQAATHWQPIAEALTQALKQLEGAGYVIEDKIQGRSWQGIPFICDFSDLQPK